jgi:type II secretory pathway component GspD/PulD (secretin)
MILSSIGPAVAVVLAGAMFPLGSAAETGTEPPAAPAVLPSLQVTNGAPEFVAMPSQPGDTAAKANANLISVTLDDVALEDVVRMFTRISGANIIASSSTLVGRVTVNLTDVEWKPALVSILDMQNLSLVEKVPNSQVYSIMPRQTNAPDPQVTSTIFLRYASVPDVVQLVTPILPEGSKVVPFPSRNALVIKTTEAVRLDVERIVAEVDKLRDQVFIEAKFMELNDGAIRDLGLNWSVLEGYGFTASPFNWENRNERRWENSTDANSLRADQRNNTDTANKLFDMYGDQFQNETITIVERPDGSFVEVTGIEPTYRQDDSIALGRNVSEDIVSSFAKTISDIRTSVLDVDQFRLVLSALKQLSGVSIVSNPKVIVANEQPATIHIGQRERPFLSVVTPATQTTAPVVTYNPGEPVDFGVKLTVTPTINTVSNITVKIEPELTRFIGDKTAPNGQSYPVIATKKIQTIFCLENGRTVAIGGLTETTDKDVTKKIPLLGDIPLIGKFLFSNSHMEKQQTKTIIFVTLGIASPSAMKSNEGIPDNSELVHRKLLQDSPKRKKMEKDIEDIVNKLEAEQKNFPAPEPAMAGNK